MDTPEIFKEAPVIAITLTLVSGAVFTMWFAACTRVLEFISSKKLFNNCARQISQSALLCTTLVCAATAVLFFYLRGLHVELLQEPTASIQPVIQNILQALMLSLPELMLTLAAALVLQIITVFSWKKLRKLHFIQVLLCLAAAIVTTFAFSALFKFCIALPSAISGAFGLALHNSAWAFYPLGIPTSFISSSLWVALAALGFALATTISACWMILQRNRADFGRDYYNFALTYCTRSALFCGLSFVLFAALSVFLLVQYNPAAEFLYKMPQTWLMLLALLASSLCIAPVKSQVALRHKAEIFFSLLFFTASTYMFCAVLQLYKTMPVLQ